VLAALIGAQALLWPVLLSVSYIR